MGRELLCWRFRSCFGVNRSQYSFWVVGCFWVACAITVGGNAYLCGAVVIERSVFLDVVVM